MNGAPTRAIPPRLPGQLLRCSLALAVIAAPTDTHRGITGAGLVGCVWIDAVAGWMLRQRGTVADALERQTELLADFICFVWAPVAWLTARGAAWPTWLGAAVFVLAGAFRLARFQVEGLVRGGYRGLPVTYNGYLVPLAGLVVAHWLPYPDWIWPAVCGLLAWLMVSTRFVVPEF